MTQKLCFKQVSKDFRKALNNSCKAYSFLTALNTLGIAAVWSSLKQEAQARWSRNTSCSNSAQHKGEKSLPWE